MWLYRYMREDCHWVVQRHLPRVGLGSGVKDEAVGIEFLNAEQT